MKPCEILAMFLITASVSRLDKHNFTMWMRRLEVRASSTVSDALFVFVPPNNPRRFFSVTEQVVSWNLTNPPRCLKPGTETVQPFLGHFSASKAPLRG